MAVQRPGSPSTGSNSPQQDNNDSSPEVREIEQRLEEGYRELEQTFELLPPEAIKHCNRALEAFKQARAAVQELEEEAALKLEVRRARAESYSQRGHQQRYLHNHAEALADLSQSLRLNPDRAEDYYYRAQSYLAKGDTALARNDLTEYLRRGNNEYLRSRAKDRIAALAPGKEDVKASLAHWRTEGMRFNSEAGELTNPKSEETPPNWLAAAKVYNQAIEAFDRALEANSADGMTKIGMITALKEQARAYRMTEEYDLALQNYKRAQQVWPDVLYLFLQGETLLEAGHTAMARQAFEQYLQKGQDRNLRAQAEKYLAAKPKGSQ